MPRALFSLRSRAGKARPVLLAVLALLAILAVLRTGQVFLQRIHAAEPVDAPPKLVKVVGIAPQPFEHTVVISGTLEPIHSVDIFPKVGGKVTHLYVKLGERVSEGQALARVEAVEWGLQAQQAEVGLAMAEQAAQLAERSLGRLEKVHEQLGSGALSQQDFEEAAIQVEGAKTQQEVARLQRDLAARMVQNATMAAPVSGVVSRIHARVGGMVGNEYPALHVDDTSSLVLRCQVGDLDLPGIAPGQEVRLESDALPGRIIVGEVVAVAPTLDSITRRAPIEIAVPNPDGDITGNLFVRGRVITGRDEEAFVLPIEAVQRQRGRASVQLVRQGSVFEAPVQVLGEGADSVAISGLDEGDQVILPGPEHLAAGERVEAVDLTVQGG
jgi:membrane fusion protein (multidrug efflux system)